MDFSIFMIIFLFFNLTMNNKSYEIKFINNKNYKKFKHHKIFLFYDIFNFFHLFIFIEFIFITFYLFFYILYNNFLITQKNNIYGFYFLTYKKNNYKNNKK